MQLEPGIEHHLPHRQPARARRPRNQVRGTFDQRVAEHRLSLRKRGAQRHNGPINGLQNLEERLCRQRGPVVRRGRVQGEDFSEAARRGRGPEGAEVG